MTFLNVCAGYKADIGTQYWKRNEKRLDKQGNARRNAIHDLMPFNIAHNEPWLEIGCGRRHNMFQKDIGIDIDSRNHPHLVLDVRHGIFFEDRSFAVVFCVGVLMHFLRTDADFVLYEMGRVASKAVIIGEYVAAVEKDRLWDYTNGSFGNGQPGLVWERPYEPPPGFHLSKTTTLDAFGDKTTFLVFERDG